MNDVRNPTTSHVTRSGYCKFIRCETKLQGRERGNKLAFDSLLGYCVKAELLLCLHNDRMIMRNYNQQTNLREKVGFSGINLELLIKLSLFMSSSTLTNISRILL